MRTRKDFIEFLKENKCLTRFKKNLFESMGLGYNWKENEVFDMFLRRQFGNEFKDERFAYIILDAFPLQWERTHDSVDFWLGLSKKWMERAYNE